MRGQLLSRVLIAIISEALLMVAMCDDVADVEPIADATIEWSSGYAPDDRCSNVVANSLASICSYN
jgi:hypothetical protein